MEFEPFMQTRTVSTVKNISIAIVGHCIEITGTAQAPIVRCVTPSCSDWSDGAKNCRFESGKILGDHGAYNDKYSFEISKTSSGICCRIMNRRGPTPDAGSWTADDGLGEQDRQARVATDVEHAKQPPG